MKILKLTFKNFKGMKDFELDLDGKSTEIFGDNETGKTTIFDGFMWLLFDRDSLNQNSFEIKPIDKKSGEVIHRINTEVVGSLEVNGKEIELKKVYYEKWTKTRGSLEETFTSNTTDYFLDGVPVKKIEYDAKIKGFVDEDAFRLLTNPLYFNEVLHWSKRRDLLMKICGEVDNEEIFKKDEELRELAEVLSNRSVEDHRKVISAKKRDLNEEIKKIPVRIDEISNNLSTFDGINWELMERELKKSRDQVTKLRDSIDDVKSGVKISHLVVNISEIENKILKLKDEIREKNYNIIGESRKKKDDAYDRFQEVERELKRTELKVASKKSEISELEKKLEDLREEFIKEDKKVLNEVIVIDVCPTCGRELPADQVESAKKKVVDDFNLKKSQSLEEIRRKAKEVIAPLIEVYQKELTSLQKEAERLGKDFDEVSRIKNETAKNHTELSEKQIRFEMNENYIEYEEEKKRIKEEIDLINSDTDKKIQEIRDEIKEIEGVKIVNIQKDLAQREQNEKFKQRIKDLEEEEKNLAKEWSLADRELWLTEKFIKANVEILTNRINSKFKLARFKMFNEQVNGGVDPCCDTMFENVPFNSLNHASRVNVGLDIINTFSGYFEFNAPIFIDNAESVVSYVSTSSQLIKLYVDGNEKKLKVKREG